MEEENSVGQKHLSSIFHLVVLLGDLAGPESSASHEH